MNKKIAVGRMFAGHTFALASGIKPVSSPLPNKCIHTRPNTGHEELINNRETLEGIESSLKTLQRIRQRQKENALIIEKTYFLERKMEMEDHKKELEDLEVRVEHWRDLSKKYEQRIFEIGEHVHILTNTSLTSERIAGTLRVQRDETRALFAREKEFTEEAENRRKLAVSSIRHRCNQEKTLLLDEIQHLREAVHNKNETIAELNAVCKTQKDEAEDRQMALCDYAEEMDLFSDKVSSILSEIHGFVLLRPDKEESVWEKMRDLHDGIKDLVREVKTRREHSQKMTDHIFTLEEERLMWSKGE